MRSLILLIFIFLCVYPCKGNPIPFAPLVRNYSTNQYKAGSQNWAVSQDESGIMYFANNGGLLEYDGFRWKLYPIGTNGIIRSVYVKNHNRIYVGSFEEFGYFERNRQNQLIYFSLKEKVADFNFHNDEIWNIIEMDGNIIFQSFGSFFVFDGNETRGYRKGSPLNLFCVGDTVYSQQMNGQLSTFDGKDFQPFLSRDYLQADVVSALPYTNGILMLTRNNAGFVYSDSGITRWSTDCDNELKHNTINRAVMTKDSCYIIGTVSNGVYAFDKEGRLLWKKNADNQLINNTVLGLYCDSDNNIWVALDNGIAYIQSNSPIYYFQPSTGKMGMVYDVLVRESDAYIASNQGLYRLDASTGRLDIIPGLEEQTWSIGQWGGQIICGHNRGTFRLINNKPILVSGIGATQIKRGKINDEEILVQGTYRSLNIYKRNSNNEWYFSNSIKNFAHMAIKIEIDHRGNVWVEHMRKGLYRVKLDNELETALEVKQYLTLGNNAGNTKCHLANVNGRIVFSDKELFYTYDDLIDSIIPYKLMNESLPAVKGIHTVNRMYKDLYWFLSDKDAYLIKCGQSDYKVIYSIPFSMFEYMPIEERAKIVYDKRFDYSYLCLNNSIARIKVDSTMLYKDEQLRSLLARGFFAIDEKTNEEIVYELAGKKEIPASFNNIKIDLSYPVYNDYSYKIRYKLEGLMPHWAEDMPGLTKEFTRLPFGSYIFKAEVYNEHGTLSEIQLPFTILRPWYLSYTAITTYILMTMLLLVLLLYTVYVFTEKKKDKAIEQQRIRHQTEIEKQEKKIIELERNQLEADLIFKSKELSEVVMTNIAHKEFLMTLKTEIQQQKLSGQYTRKNLDKLLSMLNQSLVSDEESWNVFQANFDRIHENFFRNLKEQYPELTPGDLRLCALLRLNLPTKEISKLMNISVRGVDAARYRLRKKIGLSQENSLTDFMINFK